MTYMTDTRTVGISIVDRIAALRTRMVAASTSRKVYRTTYHELDQLSDRDLSDLGLARCMIKGIAYEAAYGTE